MLSQPAKDFLATLERRSHVATTEVENLLRVADVPLVPAWLDFHERYAGYVLPLGRDVAHLGLLFDKGIWVEPRTPHVLRMPQSHEIWGIICADVHPSHDYVLDLSGQFSGAPSETFDVFIEQSARIWSFTDVPNFRGLPYPDIKDGEFRQRVLARTSLMPITPASDRFTHVLMDDTYLVFDDPEASEFKDVWERH